LPKTVAIVPAAGTGVRMGGDCAKQYLHLHDRPILAITLLALQNCNMLDAIVLVVPPKDVSYCKSEIVLKYAISKVKKVVPGGELRQDSVRKGLEATNGRYDLVLIHDGVRPMVTANLIEAVIETALRERAAIAALPAKETVKTVNKTRQVTATYDRKKVWMVQTPQAFYYDDILKAHLKAVADGMREATDDAFLVEQLGIPVSVVRGSERNIKVTTPHDLALAQFLLELEHSS
jgi:2-C-methyl-D-erythritol 4-phosphate cytidylyltransferase